LKNIDETNIQCKEKVFISRKDMFIRNGVANNTPFWYQKI
jgi:hypothetical protein